MSKGVVVALDEFHSETINYIKSTDPKKRASLGQFFTPKSLRNKLLSKLPRLHRPLVLDPACGTGEFLLSAKEYFINPELHCWEIDEDLVEIARRVVPEAKVELVNSLVKPFREEFDVVLGNPPYFEFKPDVATRVRYKEVLHGRANIYSLFIYLGIRLLKPNGYLAFVVSSSMNNGAYFKKLREYIVKNCDIVYLEKIDDPYVFADPYFKVNHTFQLLVLKKAENTGKYVFKHHGILVFTEKYEYLRKVFSTSTTLKDLGYRVQTGKVVWNQNKDKLTNDPREGVLLIWSHNIRNGTLVLGNDPYKPQYVKWDAKKADKGPAIVVNRVVGHPSRAILRAALVPPNVQFVAENHVNVIYPPPGATLEELKDIVRQLNSCEVNNIIKEITGNTQISKTELENLVPINITNKSSNLLKYLRQTH
ncbi:MAG: N-6 DNA methylase [Zestosphaera sp.]